MTPAVGPNGLVPGQAVNVLGDRVVALAQREPGDHAGFLARWTIEALAAGRVDEAELVVGWRLGEGWGSEPDPRQRRAGELTDVRRALESVVVDSAAVPEGPWSTPKVVFTPPESARSDAFVYAAKGHPELVGADLVVTHASNSFEFSKLVADTSIYFPRFVKLTIR